MSTERSRPNSAPPLEFTGERFTPECVREIFYEHWHRYAWAQTAVTGLAVLDAACGEGYGSSLLATTAASVDGIDLSADAIEHARTRYARPGLRFTQGDCLQLPFEDAQFDAVVSFETLEHLADQDRLLAEFRRVLRPSGFLLLSSPDRRTYRDLTGYDNPFHVRELYRDQLEALLARHFPAYRLYGQKLQFHSAVWALDNEDQGHELLVSDADGRITRADRPLAAPLYFLAAAAARADELPHSPLLSLFGDQAETVYAHYHQEIRKHIRAGQLLAERDREIERLKADRSVQLPRIGWWHRLRSLFRGRR